MTGWPPRKNLERTSTAVPTGSPVISVLMPAYNTERYIAAAVESILAQTFRDFEFLIVNDGSTDRTTEILREFARRDPRIRLIEQENSGYTRALNTGIDLARGEFIARMDSDDVSLPTRFAAQVEFLRSHPEVVVVGAQGIQIDEAGDPIRPLPKSLTHDEIDSRLIGRSGNERGGILHPCAMLRRSAVLAVGKYRPEFEPTEDRDLWLRLAEVGRLANLPETLLHYRVHSQSASQRRARQQHDNARRAIRDAHSRRNLPLPHEIQLWALPDERTSPLAIREDWALAAARHGYRKSAVKHAVYVLLRRPGSRKAWKALMMAVTGLKRPGPVASWFLRVLRGQPPGTNRKSAAEQP